MKWVTREGAKTDRVACPWLVRKFIDPQAAFLFVPKDKVLEVARWEGDEAPPSTAELNREAAARFGLSVAVIVLSLVYAHVKWLHIFDPVLIWLAEGFANFNEVIDWALVPVIGLIKLPWRLHQISRREPNPETVEPAQDSR